MKNVKTGFLNHTELNILLERKSFPLEIGEKRKNNLKNYVFEEEGTLFAPYLLQGVVTRWVPENRSENQYLFQLKFIYSFFLQTIFIATFSLGA